MWFEEIRANYKWLPEHKSKIRKCFKSKGSRILRNALFKVCDNKDQGKWIPTNLLEQLRVEWDGPAWKEKSKKNSNNRQSKEGLNVHNGGSISARKHTKRLKLEMNRDLNFFELYKRLHKPKGKPDEFLIEQQRKIGVRGIPKVSC